MMVTMTLMAALLASPVVATPCASRSTGAQLAARPSPLDSVTATIGGAEVKICYSRPSLKGRTAVGGDLVAFGKIWRTGANEPTVIHTTAPITIGSVRIEAGSHSIYTIPAKGEWAILINSGTEQWGTQYPTATEVGRTTGAVTALTAPVEQFTIRLSGSALILEWEQTRVTVPVAAAK